MTYTSTQTSRDVEREADESRAQLSSTLEELRERLSPGQIIDEIFSGTGTNASKFVENLGATLREHPVPALLIGAGIAMMFVGGTTAAAEGSMSSASSRRSSRIGRTDYESDYGQDDFGSHDCARESDDYSARNRSGSSGESLTEKASAMAERAKSTLSDVADSVTGLAGSVSEKVGGARETASSMTDQARNKASELSGSVSDMAHRATDMTRGTTDYVTGMARSLGDQPVLLATIGMALGATIGAALPSTEMENRMMGEASDDMKKRAQDVASEQMGKASAVASEVIEEVKSHAEEQGLSLESAKAASSGLGEKIASVVDHAAETVKQKAQGAAEDVSKAAQSGAGEAGHRDMPKSEPGKMGEAGRSDPARPGMAQGEAGRSSLGASTEMGRSEMGKGGTGKMEPGRTEQGKSEGGKDDINPVSGRRV